MRHRLRCGALSSGGGWPGGGGRIELHLLLFVPAEADQLVRDQLAQLLLRQIVELLLELEGPIRHRLYKQKTAAANCPRSSNLILVKRSALSVFICVLKVSCL